MKLQKIISIVTIFALCGSLSMFAASCSKKPKTKPVPVTLKIWKPFIDSGKMDVLIQEYKKLRPNVTIEYTKKNIENYQTDLLNALASGNGPDIFSINNAWLPQYIDKAEPAPSTIFTYRDFTESFVDVVAQDFTKDQQIYGTALSVDSLALYYNKDILGTAGIAVPPKNWEELSNVSRAVTRRDTTGYFTQTGLAAGMSANYIDRATDVLFLMMLQAGTVPWGNDNRTPQFTKVNSGAPYPESGAAGLDFYTSFANGGALNYTYNAKSDRALDAFINGRAAMVLSYAYAQDIIRAKSPSLNYGIAPAPQADLNRSAINYANYFGEIVSKQTQNPEYAWDFLKFITSKESLDKYYAKTNEISSRKDLVAAQSTDPNRAVFATANLTAKKFYQPDSARMEQIFNNAIDAVIFNGLKPAEALSQANAQASDLTRNR